MEENKKKKIVVIALGGSVIVSRKIQIKFLKKFREFILRLLKDKFKFIIVTGGGTIARDYINALSQITKVSNKEKDLIGIQATFLNASLLRAIFKKETYPKILNNPLSQKINKKYSLFIGSGWKPGFSTDYDAILLAKRFKATKIIMATNVDYVYEKDITLYKDAKPKKELSWKEYRKIINSKWEPGMKIPIDPVAAKLASQLKMTVIVAKGKDLKNLEKIIRDKKFKGTVIHP